MNNAYRFITAATLAAMLPTAAFAQWQNLPAIPAAKQGEFSLELRSIQRESGIHLGDAQGHSADSRFSFLLSAADGTRLVPHLSSLEITEALSDIGALKKVDSAVIMTLGASWSPRISWNGREGARNEETSSKTTFNISIRTPSQTRKLVRLRGTAHLTSVKNTETWSLPDLFEKPDEAKEQIKTIVVGGVPVRYRLATALLAGPSYTPYNGRLIRRGEQYQVSILVASQDNGVPLNLRQPNSDFSKLSRLGQTLHLFDAQNREFSIQDVRTNSTTNGVIDVRFVSTREQAEDKATPVRFEMKVATELSETTFPFEFKNIPLPVAEKIASP